MTPRTGRPLLGKTRTEALDRLSVRLPPESKATVRALQEVFAERGQPKPSASRILELGIEALRDALSPSERAQVEMRVRRSFRPSELVDSLPSRMESVWRSIVYSQDSSIHAFGLGASLAEVEAFELRGLIERDQDRGGSHYRLSAAGKKLAELTRRRDQK